tara:strand:+ start:495 stop:854 length:360 start_codon:yes stop_codon:yes gene_type:complete
MTAEEKALYLIEKFTEEVNLSDFHVPEFITGTKSGYGSKEYPEILKSETKSLAVGCAMAAVMELRKHHAPPHPAYWKSVKTELEKHIQYTDIIHECGTCGNNTGKLGFCPKCDTDAYSY